MKKISIQNLLLVAIVALYTAGCKKDYGNLNGATVEAFSGNATAAELNNLVSGTESGMRNALAFYLDDVGIIGREGYHFATSEPRYVTDLLGANNATLSGSNFYIATPWAARYRVIKNCNVLLQAAANSTSITAQQKLGYTGFAKMVKAYQLLLNLNLTENNGIRVNVADPDHLGPIVSNADGLTAIASLLDSASTDFSTATVSFPLAGFGSFNDAAGLLQVTKALSAGSRLPAALDCRTNGAERIFFRADQELYPRCVSCIRHGLRRPAESRIYPAKPERRSAAGASLLCNRYRSR